MTRIPALLAVLAGALSACSGPRYIDSGYGVTEYGWISVNAGSGRFEYDQRSNRLEYAEGMYAFVSRDSVALDARFDPLAIPYALYRTGNARALTHIDVSDFRTGAVVGPDSSSVVRCSASGQCRVVVFPPANLYPPPRHDSLSTALFDVRGDETIVTRVGYNDWYRIAIRDTVRVIGTGREPEYH